MPGPQTFTELVRRVRAGEEDAAAELVRRYEPSIRRDIRLKLRGTRMQRLLDSADICQSVLANFFVRASLGQFELATPKQVMKLLAQMAHNHLVTKARRLAGPLREAELAGANEPAAADASPSRLLAGRELLQKVREQLSEEERQLVELRTSGRPWAEIAAERGDSAEALRKKMGRALDRVARHLGLEGLDHE
jgi:hypothetical protein